MESKLMHAHVTYLRISIYQKSIPCVKMPKIHTFIPTRFSKVYSSVEILKTKTQDLQLPTLTFCRTNTCNCVSAFKHCTQSNFFFSYLLMVSLSLVSTNDRLSAGDSRLRDPNSLLQSSQWKAVVLVAASLLVSALP